MADVALVDKTELQSLSLSQTAAGSLPVLKAMASDALDSVTPLVRNVTTTTKLLRVGSHVLPMTVNATDHENAWVCSPYNAVVTYPLDELRHVPSPALRATLAGLIHTVAPLLRTSRVNRVVCVNNWLLSTNLYPDLSGDQIETLTTMLRDLFPGHAILFRSPRAPDFAADPSGNAIGACGATPDLLKQRKVPSRMPTEERQCRSVAFRKCAWQC